VEAYDGTQAWKINPFQGRKDPEKTVPPTTPRAWGRMRRISPGTPGGLQSQGLTALDYLGTEDVDGTEAHKLRVTRQKRRTSPTSISRSGLFSSRSARSTRRIEHGVPNETVIDYGDYEQVNGNLLPVLPRESGPRGSTDRQKVQFDKAEAKRHPPRMPSFHFPCRAPPAPARPGRFKEKNDAY